MSVIINISMKVLNIWAISCIFSRSNCISLVKNTFCLFTYEKLQCFEIYIFEVFPSKHTRLEVNFYSNEFSTKTANGNGYLGTPTVPSYKVPLAVLVGNSFNYNFASSYRVSQKKFPFSSFLHF